MYVHDGDQAVRALDLETGRELWQEPLDGPTGAQQPIAYDGFVYTGVSSGRRVRVPRSDVRLRLLAPGSSGFA